MQRPPVDIFLRFPFNIDIKQIVYGPTIGQHRSTLIEFSVNHQIIDEENSWLIDSNREKPMGNLSFHRIVQILNEDEQIRRIEIVDRLENSSSTNTAIFRFSSVTNLVNCSTLKISIRRTFRQSSCALKYLQVWASLSSTIPNVVKTKLNEILLPTVRRPAEKIEQASTPSSATEPSEFLDALTHDLMLIPMLLPSGFLIDRSTLEKCVAEDQRWSRPARDPFTLIPFDQTSEPVVAEQLKIRIDRFLSDRQHDPNYRRYGRVLDPKKKRKRSNE